jgi:hypothetical protein
MGYKKLDSATIKRLQKVGNFLLIRQTDKSWGLYNNYELTLKKSSFII